MVGRPTRLAPDDGAVVRRGASRGPRVRCSPALPSRSSPPSTRATPTLPPSGCSVREFRKPTRFSRPGADATLALEAARRRGDRRPQAALAAVQADLLDTYQARLRAALETADEAVERGFTSRAASEATLAAGYAAILAERVSRAARPGESRALDARLRRARGRAVRAGDGSCLRGGARSDRRALTGFRAAPLSARRSSAGPGSSCASSRSSRSSTAAASRTAG